MQTAVILDESRLKQLVEDYLEFDAFAFDVETVPSRKSRDLPEDKGKKLKDDPGLDPITNRVFWISFSGPGRSDVLPLGHTQPGPKQMDPDQAWDILEPLLYSDLTKIGANVKFDLTSTAKYYGMEPPPPPYEDVLTMAHILDENLYKHGGFNLENIALLVNHYKYREKLGVRIIKAPFEKAARYSCVDSKQAWLARQWMKKRIDKVPEFAFLFNLEMEVLEVLIDMYMTGVHVDREGFYREYEKYSSELYRFEARVYEMAGVKFNLRSSQQRAQYFYETLGLRCDFFTDKGAESTNSEALRVLAKKHPVAKALVDYTSMAKLVSQYFRGFIPHIQDDDRIRAHYKGTGPVTGRYACVTGDTILPTSRGDFRFDEYKVQPGDQVLTHWGTWERVMQKMYQGVREVYAVGLENGEVLKCTGDHRIYTPTGWRTVDSLNPGDVVVSVKAVCGKSKERGSRAQDVLRTQKANDKRNSGNSRDYLPQRALDFTRTSRPEKAQSRAGSALFEVHDAGEPNARPSGGEAPQLQRRSGRRARVSSDQDQREICISTSSCVGGSVGPGGSPLMVRRASHKRGQAEQRHSQLGPGNPRRAQCFTQENSKVREITALGAVPVWDIEVAQAHSYAAQGFLNHNCGRPNLQNIPIRRQESFDSTVVRKLFTAPEDLGEEYTLLVGDYSQIELRILADRCRDPMLLKAYIEGIDLHTLTASMVYRVAFEKVEKWQRAIGKTSNFNFAFEGGPGRVIEAVEKDGGKITKAEAQRVYDGWHQAYPRVRKWGDYQKMLARQKGYVETIYGRRRRLPEINFKGSSDQTRKMVGYAERQAVNHPIQGSAGDLAKIATVRLYRAFQGTKASLVMQVHDEFIVQCPKSFEEEGIALMREAMEGIKKDGKPPLRVPLIADIHSGKTWSEAK